MTWLSYRKFIVDRIVAESISAKSFYLTPADGGSVAAHEPGQHLPLRLMIPGQPAPVLRTYTLSDCDNGRCYRLTIKKESPPEDQPDAPGGISSTYFNDVVRAGDVIEARMPAGNFFLDVRQNHPVALIAGGIGVTPLLSMLNACVGRQPNRDIWFFFSVRHGGDHVFKNHLRSLTETHPHIHHHTFYSQPKSEDRPGIDYHHAGRIDVPLLATILPTLLMEYYLCGPDKMMQAIITGLVEAGVDRERIHTESFGTTSPAFEDKPQTSSDVASARNVSQSIDVTFQKSGKVLPWTAKDKSILEFAERHGIDMDFGCRYGDCATCMTPLLKGRVSYNHPISAQPDPGTCLPCSCRPDGSISLDA